MAKLNQNAFAKSGLFPLDRSKIDAERCSVAESVNDSTVPSLNGTTPSSVDSNPSTIKKVENTSTSHNISSVTVTKDPHPLPVSIPVSPLPASISSAPFKSSTPAANTRRNIMATTSENVSQSQFNALETSILTQLQFLNFKKKS